LRKHKNESFGKTPLSEIWRHPIHTREFGSQITNVLRCLQLEAHGYQVTVTELVGWEHSMKNELIIATRGATTQRKSAQRLDTMLSQLGLDDMRPRFFTDEPPQRTCRAGRADVRHALQSAASSACALHQNRQYL
jgi:hypothetical protein